MSDRKIVLFSAIRRLLPSDYDNWLEQTALQGWHIDPLRQWSSVFLVFKRGELERYRFVYDPQVSQRKET